MPDCGPIIAGAYKDYTDIERARNAMPDSFLARHVPWAERLGENVSAKFQGRVEGGVGDIYERSRMLESALNENVGDNVDKLTLALNRRVYGHRGKPGFLDDIEYRGPKEFADAANGVHRDLVFFTTPRDYWKGVPAGAYDEIEQLRKISETAKVHAEQLGYPSAASRENYLRQEWEEVEEAVTTFKDPKGGGTISPSKQRAIPNHAVGINAGLTPTSKTVGELAADAVALWNRAVAEAFERRLVLQRYGAEVRVKPGVDAAKSGKANFSSSIYRGWSADRKIVEAVDGLHKPLGKVQRGAGNIAATIKNSTFGLLDIGVMGVHGLLAIAEGGPTMLANSVVRGLALVKFAPARQFIELMESGQLPLMTKFANNGLHFGVGPASVTPGQGTPLKYIPLVGKRLDKPVSDFIDAKAKVEFGMILQNLRVHLAQGNLLLLHMTGNDISNPAVFKRAMDWSNTMTGASRGAQTPQRRGLENWALTSAQLTRSQMGMLGSLARAATVGTADEKLLATATLANFGLMVYGVGSAINMAFGNGPVEWNPKKPDWAQIQVGGHKIPIVPQRSLITAIVRSIKEIEDMDKESFDRLAEIWGQYTISKGGPGSIAPVANLLGFGFDPDKGFQAGTLDTKYRILNGIPFPPLVNQLIGDADSRNAISAGFSFAGFTEFPVSARDTLSETFQNEVGHAFGDQLSDRRVAKARFPDLLAAMDKQSTESGFQPAIDRQRREDALRQKAENEGLEQLAQSALEGDIENPVAARRLISELNSDAAILLQSDIQDVEFDEPDNDRDRRYAGYISIQQTVKQFPSDTGPGVDDEAFWAAKEAAFQLLDQEDRDAIEATLSTFTPAAQELERKLNEDRDFIDTAKLDGFDFNYWEVSDEIFDKFGYNRNELASAAAVVGGETERQILSGINRTVTKIRAEMRRQLPGLNARLAYWGYTKKLVASNVRDAAGNNVVDIWRIEYPATRDIRAFAQP